MWRGDTFDRVADEIKAAPQFGIHGNYITSDVVPDAERQQLTEELGCVAYF
jgi:hypothetical protein